VKVAIAAGRWPAEAGGEAAYAAGLAEHLTRGGHDVVLVARGASSDAPYVVRGVASRRLRRVRLTWLLGRAGLGADVVYDVGLLGEAVAATGLLHRPLVVKLAGDPALARGRRLGLVRAEEAPLRWGGAAALALRAARSAALRRATRVVCSSAWLAGRAGAWGLAEERLAVVPHPAPAIPQLRPREELRTSFGFAGPVVVYAGRLTAERRLDRLVEALALAPRVGLVLAGEGPDAPRLRDLAHERGVARRLQIHGHVPHARLLELFHAADLAVQPAVAGVFPNAALEALTVGRPVLTTLAAGAPELVRDGENGLVVDPLDPRALAVAVDRYLDDAQLRERLERSASVSALGHAPERVHAQLEAVLAEAAAEAA
jgi:glycosyltransferase involved in cell wall biosynthesis